MIMNAQSQSGKPRRRPLRLRGYDYTRPGACFVTVCTYRRACLFGHISHSVMCLNGFGTVVEACWRALPEHYPHVGLDAFVIMPNHIHGILVLADDPIAGGANPRRHGLPEVVRACKTFSSRRINALRNRGGAQVWQRGYYEHVIRDEMSLRRLPDYIDTNPLRWELDSENPRNTHRVGAGFKPALTPAPTRYQP